MRHRKPLWIIVSGFLVCGLGYYFLSKAEERNQTSRFIDQIPAAIETTKKVSIGSQKSVLHSCGAAIFELSESTLSGIAKDHLNYFASAVFPKSDDGRKTNLPYYAWSKTPLPIKWTGEGVWSGLRCLPEANAAENSFLFEILRAGRTEGSYFTSHYHGATLVVIPKLRVVVYAYDGT